MTGNGREEKRTLGDMQIMQTCWLNSYSTHVTCSNLCSFIPTYSHLHQIFPVCLPKNNNCEKSVSVWRSSKQKVHFLCWHLNSCRRSKLHDPQSKALLMRGDQSNKAENGLSWTHFEVRERERDEKKRKQDRRKGGIEREREIEKESKNAREERLLGCLALCLCPCLSLLEACS